MTDIPEKPKRGRPPGSKNRKTLERLAELEKTAEVTEPVVRAKLKMKNKPGEPTPAVTSKGKSGKSCTAP